jgi:MFS superfamily sulfate permease-like transporter
LKRTIKYYRIIWLKYDLPAGLSVFLVALPLCLGIALASGVPLYSGLLSGIVGGIVVSLVSGSQLAVSGPAAGLVALVAASIISLGDMSSLFLAVLVAGVFQLLIGVFRLASFANYFPSAVIKGMMAAIGIILVSKQIPLALGYNQPDFWTSGFLQLFSAGNFLGNITEFNHHITRGAILITVISLVILFRMQQDSAKKLKVIPAPLVVVVVAVLTNFLYTYFTSETLLKHNQLVNIPPNVFHDINFPDVSNLFSNFKIWKEGIVIGMLATLETLLCIEAIDKLDKRNRITPINRELVAQGVGNMVCGILGALPVTAVVVRGAANADAGGRTKMSAFTHGLFLLVAVVFFPFLLNMIPYAGLAAILIITGYNLAKPQLFYGMWKLGLKQFLPFLITIIVILLTDLLVGVCIGLIIAVYFIIQDNFRIEFNLSKIHTNTERESYFLKLHTSVSFLNKVKLRKTLDEIPENCKLIIDGSETKFMDYDILEIITNYEISAKQKKIELELIGIEKIALVKAAH